MQHLIVLDVMLPGISGIDVAPASADSDSRPKKAGDLGFWEELAFWESIKSSQDPAEFEALMDGAAYAEFAEKSS